MSAYEDARQAYWDAQSAFRQEAIRKIEGLIPEGASAVLLDMSDDADMPRLRFASFVYEGEIDDEYDYEAEEIDTVAAEMECFVFYEADNILLSDGAGAWKIEKASVEA